MYKDDSLAKDYKSVWTHCMRFIQQEVNAQDCSTWFEPIVPKKLIDYTLTIQVPSQFFYEWLEKNYLTLLRRAVDGALGPRGKLAYAVIVNNGGTSQRPSPIKLTSSSNGYTTKLGYGFNQENTSFQSPFILKSIANAKKESHLNPSYTFDTLVEGACNQLAKSAAQAIAKKPGGTSFNPFMIYGGVGLGKTHIAQALGNEIKTSFEDKFVLYVSSEQFTTQFIEALRNNKMQNFSHFYLQTDLLIIDDVQFLAGKEKTQEIFFHIFNHLHQAGKQIVMTSDCPPRQLKGLQERLISRFKWGLTADLQQPDFETRVAIIQRKIAVGGIHIPDALVQYIAHSVNTNIRELEGVIVSLIAYASLRKEDITLELARQVLKNIVHEIHTEVSVDYIQKVVANYYDVSLANLKSRSRKKEIVMARQVAMYFAKRHTNHSLQSIGDYFGGRDHSTVIHALQAVDNRLAIEPRFKLAFNKLKEKIKLKEPFL